MEKSQMKKVGVIIIALCMLFAFASCTGGAVGYWQIQEIQAGDITMGEEDAENIGLNMLGAFKLQKSGNCVVTLLGEDSNGTWEQAEDGIITVTTENEAVYKGSIDDDKVLFLTDAQGVQYKLEK